MVGIQLIQPSQTINGGAPVLLVEILGGQAIDDPFTSMNVSA